MNKKYFNLNCAKYLGIFYSDGESIFVLHDGESMPCEFDAYSDANDRNMVIEKMKIESRYWYDENKWTCLVSGGVGAQDESMAVAQRKCIEAVLST